MQPEIVAALIGVGGVVLGFVISYQLGKRQSVDQDLRARRIEVTTAVRSKTYEVSKDFDRLWEAYEARNHNKTFEYLQDVTRKINNLADFYQRNKPWLPAEARPLVEACIADVRRFLTEATAPLRSVEKRAIFWHANTKNTADALRQRLEDLDGHSSRVIGAQCPWWRRVFGP